MEEIIKKCKCGVYLEVNKYRDYYMSAKEAVDEINQRGIERKNPHKEIDEELEQKIISSDTLYELQFYPDTPVGFYVVYGTSLNEVVDKALSVLK